MTAQPDFASPAEDQPLSTTELPRTLGPLALVLLAMSSATPLASVVGLLPLCFGMGNGTGVPLTFAFCTLVLLVFAVGYVALSLESPGGGNFYTFIAQTLGVETGFGAALVSVISYAAMLWGCLAYIGFYAQTAVIDLLGIETPWQIYSAAALVFIGLLGLRQIDLSSRILGTVVMVEFLMIMALNLAIVIRHGGGAFPAAALNPHAFGHGAPGVSIMLAFTSYVGFEAVALYSPESRSPQRNVPIAAYGAVTAMGAFYFLTAWITVGALGADRIQGEALAQSANLYLSLTADYFGLAAGRVLALAMILSVFAAMLAGHNITSRYLFVLGRQGFLASRLAAVHTVYRSPFVASLTVSLMAVPFFLICCFSGLDPISGLGGPALGLGIIGVVALQAVTCVAVVIRFARRGHLHWWRTLLAPALGFVGLMAALILAIVNFDVLTGSATWWSGLLPWIPVLVFAGGVVYAVGLRLRSNARFSAIARNIA